MKLELPDTQQLALVLYLWATDLGYEHCSVGPQPTALYSCSLEYHNQDQFPGSASSCIQLGAVYQRELVLSTCVSCKNPSDVEVQAGTHRAHSERASNRNTTVQDPPNTDAGTLPGERGHPCQV